MSHVWVSEWIADMISRLFACVKFIVFVHVEFAPLLKLSGRVTLLKLIAGVGEIILIWVSAINISEELMYSKALVGTKSIVDDEL